MYLITALERFGEDCLIYIESTSMLKDKWWPFPQIVLLFRTSSWIDGGKTYGQKMENGGTFPLAEKHY